jgi:hypothetical protein
MQSDFSYYQSLVDSLSILGKPNVELVLRALEREDVIHEGRIDLERIEPVLRSIFGDGAKVFLEFARTAKTV